MNKKCDSCRRSFNGTNGNGYSPCSCEKQVKPDIVSAPGPIRIDTRSKNRTSFWGKWFK